MELEGLEGLEELEEPAGEVEVVVEAAAGEVEEVGVEADQGLAVNNKCKN